MTKAQISCILQGVKKHTLLRMKCLGTGEHLHDGVAQWIERQFAELNVAGSSPVTVAFLFLALLKFVWLVVVR